MSVKSKNPCPVCGNKEFSLYGIVGEVLMDSNGHNVQDFDLGDLLGLVDLDDNWNDGLVDFCTKCETGFTSA
jgi:hypothetical protein